MTYGIPERFLTDNSASLAGTFFDDFCIALGTRLMKTTVCYLHTNGQTKRSNKIIFRVCRHYTIEHHDNWDLIVQSTICAYNSEETTKTSPFSVLLKREPSAASGLPRLPHTLSQQKQSPTSMELLTSLLDKFGVIRARDTKAASMAQRRNKTSFDKKKTNRFPFLKTAKSSIQITACCFCVSNPVTRQKK